jgi:acyl-CoA reductase-like NAD-dependent aldehyde dehydrogenase
MVTDMPEDAPLMTEEQFCPAIPVATYDDLDDAVKRSRRGRYPLRDDRLRRVELPESAPTDGR